MPSITATIDRDHRDGLYELVRHHLYSIEDLWIAFGRSRDFATAERLGVEYGEASACWPTSAGSQTTIASASS